MTDSIYPVINDVPFTPREFTHKDKEILSKVGTMSREYFSKEILHEYVPLDYIHFDQYSRNELRWTPEQRESLLVLLLHFQNEEKTGKLSPYTTVRNCLSSFFDSEGV